MMQLMADIELVLADVLQSGLATGSMSAAARAGTLSQACADMGLHTCSQLLWNLKVKLENRSHCMEKDDLSIVADISRIARYIQLFRDKVQEENIHQRWQETMDTNTGGNA